MTGKPVAREAILQRHVKLFVRDAVTAPHEFLAFDRAKASARFTHLRERDTGIRKGTPDTMLAVVGFPPIWVELKAPGRKPEDAQWAMANALRAVGHKWDWCISVETYRRILMELDVPMTANSDFIAMTHDGAVASLIAKAEAKRGDTPKSYVAKAKAKPRYSATGKRAGRMMVLP